MKTFSSIVHCTTYTHATEQRTEQHNKLGTFIFYFLDTLTTEGESSYAESLQPTASQPGSTGESGSHLLGLLPGIVSVIESCHYLVLHDLNKAALSSTVAVPLV